MNQLEADHAYLRTLTLLYVAAVPGEGVADRQNLEPLVGQLVLAEDGATALEALRVHRPHLVFTDSLLPDQDGVALASAIRTLAPEVPIVVAAAPDDAAFLVRSLKLGVEQHVFKPVDREALHRALLKCAHRLAAEAELVRKREQEDLEARLKHQEALRDLARGMGHDFNNLLQGILGAVSVAKLSTPPTHQLRGILDLAENSANQARELGRRLICLAKGPAPLNHAGVLGPMLRFSVEAALKGTAVTPVFDLPEDTPAVDFDEQDLRLLIDLLMANAQEAMPAGGTLTVAVRTCAVTASDGLPLPSGSYVRCSFRDSGRGIPEEFLPRIFDPYFTTKTGKNPKGVGLSLTICQAIARSHRGTLTAETSGEGGAAFHLYLPFNPVANPG